jgi:hypothetical protein
MSRVKLFFLSTVISVALPMFSQGAMQSHPIKEFKTDYHEHFDRDTRWRLDLSVSPTFQQQVINPRRVARWSPYCFENTDSYKGPSCNWVFREVVAPDR